MRKKTFWTLGALVLLIIVDVSCMVAKQYVEVPRNKEDTTTEAEHTQPEQAAMPQVKLKPPPKGETYTTGHYHGDQWHRTAPPKPESITFNGETLTYDQIVSKLVYGSSYDRPELQRLILEEFPYSGGALMVRYRLEIYGETKEVRLSRLKKMLKYHSDAPRILKDLLVLTEEKNPEEAIKYGKAALKYIDIYPQRSYYMFRTYSEKVHGKLAFAYQRVGDYKTALVHLKKADQILNANPDRIHYYNAKIYSNHIKRIENGEPIYGPLSIYKRNR